VLPAVLKYIACLSFACCSGIFHSCIFSAPVHASKTAQKLARSELAEETEDDLLQAKRNKQTYGLLPGCRAHARVQVPDDRK